MSHSTIAVLLLIFKCLIAVLVGIFEGNGAVYVFNQMPAKWFCDYGEEPTKEMLERSSQRIKSSPWKYLFTMLFIVLNIKLVTDDWIFAIPGTAALWLLMELSLADIKFKVVPDQILILLAITGLGFMQYHGSWKAPVIGAAIGFGITMAIAGLGRLLYKNDTLGGGDIKLFAVLGFLAGPSGIVFIFIVSTVISALHFGILLARKLIKRTDSRAMVPYISIGAAVYLVFFWDKFSEIII